MWTAKHVNSQVACLLSAYPEPTSPPPRARTEQLSTLVLLFPCAAGHLAWKKWFRSQHTFRYLLCNCFLLPVITHHSLIWLFNSHLSVYTDLHVFLYGHEAWVFNKHHFEHLGMAAPLATTDLFLSTFEQMRTGRGWSLKSNIFIRCQLYVPDRDKEGLQ